MGYALFLLVFCVNLQKKEALPRLSRQCHIRGGLTVIKTVKHLNGDKENLPFFFILQNDHTLCFP